MAQRLLIEIVGNQPGDDGLTGSPRQHSDVVHLFQSAMEAQVSIVWIIIIGLVAGIIARMVSPGPNNPTGFILTGLLGIAGAFVSTFIGQAVGWYRPDQGAGLLGATVGAVLVLFIWNRLVARRVISDPGNRRWL
jgi:uncharacterized membrane protein YeaQ/YmgE (transglycosylase-associated protein family)